MDASLTINLQVNKLYEIIVSNFSILANTRHFFDSDTAFMLYRSLVVPILGYFFDFDSYWR